MNSLEINVDWKIIKGTLMQKWANLTDDDLLLVEGKLQEVCGRIQKRTGESLASIEKAVKEAVFRSNPD